MDPYYTSRIQINYNLAIYMTYVYAWMFLGMLFSGASAFLVLIVPGLLQVIFGNEIVFYGIILFQLALVFALSAFSRNMPAPLAALMFIIYSTTIGATLSIIVLLYTLSSIFMVFFISAGIFASMSIYGYFTKKDLSGIAMILYMLLVGIILAGIANIFILRSSTIDFATAVVGVIVFTGLTAYDVQKIKKIGLEGTARDSVNKLAILGALTLYLDFINLFLSLLRVFGSRRR